MTGIIVFFRSTRGGGSSTLLSQIVFLDQQDGGSSTLLSQIGRLINNEIMPSTSCWLLDLLKRPRYDHDFSVVTSPRPRHEQRARVLRKNEGKTHALAWTGRPCLVRSSPPPP
jgi:hypothetical protein